MIKLSYIFQSYPVFYQPYINPIVDSFLVDETYKFNLVGVSKTESKIKKKLIWFTEVIQSKVTNSTLTSLQKQLLEQDIVHVQHSFLYPIFKDIVQQRNGRQPKLVITLRGADTYIKPLVNKKWSNFYKEDYFDAYIVMSHNQKEKLESLGVSSNKIHIIPISYGKPFKTNVKSADSKQIKIVSAFRLCWEKNINGNLLVIKELVKQGYPIQYDIYGSGTEKKMLFYLIDKYQLQKNVSYKGVIPNEELKTKLSNYDFYLQLSLSESFGMSVVEAQTYGIPAIVSNIGGLPDIVLNDKTGFTVTPNDYKKAARKLVKLWKDPNRYAEFSCNAIKHAQENFNTQKEVNKLDELYKSIINEK
jgi:glycosyltransferase involved in cell wall biosynthesis